MSQFDFPRIHFSGFTTINPSTGNNGYHLPLCFYDPVETKPVLPPKLFLENRFYKPGISWEQLKNLIPKNSPVIDSEPYGRYIEIIPVSDRNSFRIWASTLLGRCDLDKEYHQLYKNLMAPKLRGTIYGEYPGYWNYYGDMTLSFDSVRVESIQFENEHGIIKTFKLNDEIIPDQLRLFLGAEFGLTDDSGKTSAVIIDVTPTEAYYTQIFCDEMRMMKDKKVLFRGKPSKASVRFYNPSRIINQNNIIGASGCFYSSIPFESIKYPESSPLVNFFKNHCERPEDLAGLFIRYDLFEVIENRKPDYHDSNINGNPARSSVTGSITPWYTGDMKSITIGRQLIPENPFLEDKSLGSMISCVNYKKKRVSLDLIGNIPEINKSIKSNTDYSYFPQDYETYKFGKLYLKLESPLGLTEVIGSFSIGPDNLSKEWLKQTGGILDIPFNLDDHKIKTGQLIITGLQKKDENDPGVEVVLMKESKYFITTDQTGIYAHAGENPKDGYISYSYKPESCRIRIFEKGEPLQKSVKIKVLEYKIHQNGVIIAPSDILHDKEVCDNEEVFFPLQKACNSIFLFTSEIRLNTISNFVSELLKTGAFVNLRVLPTQDYSKYLDHSDPRFINKIPYSLIYDEIFKFYDLIYPVSSIISPFDENSILKANQLLIKLMSPDNWSSNTYMPSSRELSKMQYRLFLKWIEQNTEK